MPRQENPFQHYALEDYWSDGFKTGLVLRQEGSATMRQNVSDFRNDVYHHSNPELGDSSLYKTATGLVAMRFATDGAHLPVRYFSDVNPDYDEALPGQQRLKFAEGVRTAMRGQE